MDEIFEKKLISTKNAAELSGYSPDYLSRLARSGKINGKRIVIKQVNKLLSEQIVFLAKSLGFFVNTGIEKKINVICPNTTSKNYQDQIRINISGVNLSKIPTILSRKKCISTGINNHFTLYAKGPSLANSGLPFYIDGLPNLTDNVNLYVGGF